jgi:hypothetical protein
LEGSSESKVSTELGRDSSTGTGVAGASVMPGL